MTELIQSSAPSLSSIPQSFSLSSFNFGTWAGLVALAAVVGTCWRYVSIGLSWVKNLFICRVILKEEVSRAFQACIWQKAIPSPLGTRLFGGTTAFVAPKRRIEVVAYEGIMSEPRLFWFRMTPVIFKVGFAGGFPNSNSEDQVNIGNQVGSSSPCSIWFIRGTLNIDKLVESAVLDYNQTRQSVPTVDDKVEIRSKRFAIINKRASAYGGNMENPQAISSKSIYPSSRTSVDTLDELRRNELRLLSWKPEDLTDKSPESAPPFTNHPVSPKIMEEFEEVETWLSHEQWFRSRGIAWRKGYLLFGEPGSGKSTIIRNLAMKYDLPIYTFDLSSYDNASFTEDWRSMSQNVPAIALLEDVDCVFSGRENVTSTANRTGLTFDCLLNTLSGVGSNDGILLFITTNRIESLDPALGIPQDGKTSQRSTRPGRIDRAIYVGYMEEPERQKLAQIILSDWPELVDSTVAAGHGETAAQFQERCSELAQKEFWKKNSQKRA